MFRLLILSLALITAGFAESISLDGIRMHVVQTADCGVVNHETVFSFSQKDGLVTAQYQGGKIAQGFLVGKFLAEDQLEFSYCQMQIDGTVDNGVSTCEVEFSLDGKITLIEHFEWKSR
ncbi:MAG: hypothetical protein JSS12_04690, partial [Verrucomicrobia bacterium]|nr:hypothetical protein [Verrucomicrobiota bacterium]